MMISPERFGEIQAAVVELLTARGPLPLSEIRAALFTLCSTNYIDRAVRALLEAGRVVAEKRRLESTYHGTHHGRPRTQRYEATVYFVAPATSADDGPRARRRPPR